MKSKKQKVLKSKNRSILVTSIAILALILVGVLTYQLVLNKSDMDFAKTDIAVKDTITYTLPTGWTEETNISYMENKGDVLLKSQGYKDSTTTSPEGNGVRIHLTVSPQSMFQTLGSEKRIEARGGFSNFTDITIDEVPGIKYELSKDGTYAMKYFVIKDNTTLRIYVEKYNNKSIEEGYMSDINSIINSIQFK